MFNIYRWKSTTLVLKYITILTVVSFLCPWQSSSATNIGIKDTPLTPVGAIRAGNAEGTIPAWDGGITVAPSGYQIGKVYVDPYPDDAPLFTITAANYQEYRDKMTAGQIKMFELHPDSFKMLIYPTRRSASLPNDIYEKTIQGQGKTRICAGSEHCLESIPEAGAGILFPEPQNGLEAMWNHSLFFNGYYYQTITPGNNIVVMEDGKYYINTLHEYSIRFINLPAAQRPDGGSGRGLAKWCYNLTYVYPPRTAGQIIGGCDYERSHTFDGYIYIPGQRRVRKAPLSGLYDTPGDASDGLRTSDAGWMFRLSGDSSDARYDHELLGRMEKFIPYNSYRLVDKNADDIVRPFHPNQDLIRYELHRVWVVESRLRQGYRHLIPRRLTYIDEDSWAGAAGDYYDEDDKLWRYAEAYLINYYDVPMVDYWGSFHFDFAAGRYVSENGWWNFGGGVPKDFRTMPSMDNFRPDGLRRLGTR